MMSACQGSSYSDVEACLLSWWHCLVGGEWCCGIWLELYEHQLYWEESLWWIESKDFFIVVYLLYFVNLFIVIKCNYFWSLQILMKFTIIAGIQTFTLWCIYVFKRIHPWGHRGRQKEAERLYIERETEKPDSQGMERDRQKEVDLPYTERERKIDST